MAQRLEMDFGSTLLIDTVNIYHKGGFCRSKNRFILHISYQGSSWTSTKPQNFERELNHLKKTTSNIKKIKILRKEFEAYKKFKNSPYLTKLLRKLFYKISNLLIIKI